MIQLSKFWQVVIFSIKGLIFVHLWKKAGAKMDIFCRYCVSSPLHCSMQYDIVWIHTNHIHTWLGAYDLNCCYISCLEVERCAENKTMG